MSKLITYIPLSSVERMELRIDAWDDLTTWQRRQAEEQAQAYAAFRERELAAFCLDREH